jgi:hypothetical protein
MYHVGDVVTVNDTMQASYQYSLQVPMGQKFASGFNPHFTPKEMLELGVFEGKYCNDCQNEFPSEWFTNAKIGDSSDPSVNYFGVKSRQSLNIWKEKGWIIGPDPRGCFQWYCRYFMDRRIAEVDQKQTTRWRSFRRHAAQVRANCDQKGDWTCRPRQRQALLQWSYDPFI